MNVLGRLIALLAWTLLLGAGTAAAAITAGKDYRLIIPPQPTESGAKVEVIEFFWYGCPHCSNLQPSLRAWLKRKPADVEFRRVPAVFQESWVPLTRTYYALEALEVVERLHYDVFAAVHDQKLKLNDPKVLFDWVGTKGVDKQKFADTYNSFAVQGRTQRSIDLTNSYDIPGTPALVVAGRYLVSPSMALRNDKTIDYVRYFQIVDEVIKLARK